MSRKAPPVNYPALVNQRCELVAASLARLSENAPLAELEPLAFALYRLLLCYCNEVMASTGTEKVVTTLEDLPAQAELPPELRELWLAFDGLLPSWLQAWQDSQRLFALSDQSSGSTTEKAGEERAVNLIASSLSAPTEVHRLDLPGCRRVFRLLQTSIERQRQHLQEW